MKIKNVLLVCLLLSFSLVLTGCDDIWEIFAPDEEIQHAVDKGDAGLCLKIKDEDANDELRRQNKCLDRVAEKTNDPKACKLIVGDESRMNNCFKSVAAGLAKEEVCEEINNNEKLKASCFADVGIASGNESLCAKKGLSAWEKKNCYTKIAENKKDETICDNLENEREKAECYKFVGVVAESIEICNKIPKSQAIQRTRCINGIAQTKKSIDICTEHGDDDNEETCIRIVAQETNNASLCEKLLIAIRMTRKRLLICALKR